MQSLTDLQIVVKRGEAIPLLSDIVRAEQFHALPQEHDAVYEIPGLTISGLCLYCPSHSSQQLSCVDETRRIRSQTILAGRCY